jgi:radical SAM-linked protein
MFTIEFVFTKKGMMRFISHLDLMRLLVRAMRRAKLPLKLTEGFSPHPKLSIQRALKLGVESEQELASIVLKDLVKPDQFSRQLQQSLPEGITIVSAALK